MLDPDNEDYLFIKDAGDVQDLGCVWTKELQALVRSMHKNYEYHQREYVDGFNPSIQRRNLALKDLEGARRNLLAYPSSKGRTPHTCWALPSTSTRDGSAKVSTGGTTI